MQPGYNRNERERPLQKSMFLPSSEYSVRNNTSEYQYQQLNGMKRSAVGIDSGKLYNYGSNQQTPSQQYNVNNNPILNFSGTSRPKQNFKVNNNNSLPSIQPGSELTLAQVTEKLEKVISTIHNHDEILKRNNLFDPNKDGLLESQIITIENRLRDKVIPSLINQSNKEIYQHIFNFKLQIQVFKDNMTTFNESLQKSKKQLDQALKQIGSKTNRSQFSSHSTDKGSILGNQQSLSQMSAAIYSLENKVSDLQRSIGTESVKNIVASELAKSRKQFSPIKMKQSYAKSTLPSFMIQYQELFVIKNSSNNSNKASLSKGKDQNQQILLNSSTYYVDKDGYLLDGQNRYIVDQKGMQIQLEQSHINLLKQHHAFG